MRENYKNLNEPIVVQNCQETGLCSIDPILNSIEEIFLYEIGQIAYYLTKASYFGFKNENAEKQVIEALSFEFASSDLNEEYLKSSLIELVELKEEIKKGYLYFCKNSPQGSETINFALEIDPRKPIGRLIKDGEKLIKHKNSLLDIDKNKYFELITTISRICAQNLSKIYSYELDYKENRFELIRFFSLRNLYYLKAEKLKRKILEFSDIVYEIREKTNEVISNYYGKRSECNIQTTLSKGKSILVCGGDLKELENILLAIKNSDISVYTHGELLIAHSYEKFKNYKNLKGHYDTGYLKCDFSNFNGVIYITKYMSQKIEQVYKGIIISKEKVTPKGVIRNYNNNYDELIKYTEKYQREEDFNIKTKARLIYDINSIDEVFENKPDDIVVFVGGNNGEKLLDNFGEKKVVNLHYQTDSDLFHYVIEKSQEANTKLIFFFSKCTKRTISMISSLFNKKNIEKIYLIKCPITNMSPHIIECLNENFGVKIIN